MRIFLTNYKDEAGTGKINFVDENNVLLGFEVDNECCEHSGFYILDHISSKIPEDAFSESTPQEDLPSIQNHIFDTSFILEIKGIDEIEDGSIVVFRIIEKTTYKRSEKFIHIFNGQNGNYSHGFTFKNGSEIIKENDI